MTPAAQRIYSALHERYGNYGDDVSLDVDSSGEHIVIGQNANRPLTVCSVFEHNQNIVASMQRSIYIPTVSIRRPELAAGMIIGTLTALELKAQHARK